jgi:hypothetical protein
MGDLKYGSAILNLGNVLSFAIPTLYPPGKEAPVPTG